MPRPKKAPGEAVDSRNGTRLTLVGTETPAERPEPPSGLCKEAKEQWNSYWDDAVAGILNPAELGLVVRWITNVDEWHRAMKAFRKERMVRGSTGQPVVNPLAQYIASREAAIEKAEDRLGLSPLARMKLGVAIGEAHRSLDEMNRALEAPEESEEVEEIDPRTVVEIPASNARR